RRNTLKRIILAFFKLLFFVLVFLVNQLTNANALFFCIFHFLVVVLNNICIADLKLSLMACELFCSLPALAKTYCQITLLPIFLFNSKLRLDGFFCRIR
ncbi:hypothetical protein, partial [Prochlorococcus sp. P1361]|uniref:hypothetical protein n=2 Tax=unclassified Prochlorococcus TaxID=2627481 RepID=UPI00197FB6BB